MMRSEINPLHKKKNILAHNGNNIKQSPRGEQINLPLQMDFINLRVFGPEEIRLRCAITNID